MRTIRIKNVQYFYILHSSTQIIERVPMCKEFDITAKVTEGKKYAGYGSEYRKMGNYATVLFGGGGVNALKESYPEAEFVDNKLLDNGTAYDGNQGTPATYAVRRANFYTENGKKMHPVANRLYALVEVDAKYFEHSFVLLTQSIDSQGVIQGYSTMAALDGNTYKIDAKVNGEESQVALSATGSISCYVDGVQKNWSIQPTTFGVQRGYVLTIRGASNIAGLLPDTEYRITCIIKTLDGVELNTNRVVVLYTGQFTQDTLTARIEEI